MTLVKTTVTSEISSATDANITLHLLDVPWTVDDQAAQTVMNALWREVLVSTPPNHTIHVFSDEAMTAYNRQVLKNIKRISIELLNHQVLMSLVFHD